MIAVARRPVREYVDFAIIPASQWEMHTRLENWAKWCRGASRQSGVPGCPMFALYRASNVRSEYGLETPIPVKKDDAEALHAHISALSDVRHRWALHWYYTRQGTSPNRMARQLNVSLHILAGLVIEARVLLMDS